jgi:hypothetical protein
VVLGGEQEHQDQYHVDNAKDQARQRHSAAPGALIGAVEADGPEDNRERAENKLGDEDSNDSADQGGDSEPVGPPAQDPWLVPVTISAR